MRVSDSDPEMLRFLAERGIAPGDGSRSSTQPFGGPLFVRFGDDEHVLGGELARRDAGRGAGRDDRRRRARRPALEGAAADGALRARRHVARSPLERLLARGRLRATLAMLGPAFVASVAYVDPGNFATNIQGGAKFGYLLLWVVLLANLMAMLIQYLSAKLGIVTDRSLPEVVPRAVAALDHAGAVGPGRDHGDGDRHRGVPRRRARTEPAVRRAAAHRRADHRRDRVRDPRAAGAAATGASSSRSPACSGSCFAGFLYETLRIGPSVHESLGGLVPGLSGASSLYLAVGIIGATVMPHAIYLHSALTNGRMPVRNDAERRSVLRFQRLDVIIALGLAGARQHGHARRRGKAFPRAGAVGR